MEQIVRIDITSDSMNLANVREVISEVAHLAGLADANGITLAVDEAVSNIIRHGYRGEAGRPIEIDIGHQRVEGASAMVVVLRDRGQQVAPAEIVGRDLSDIRPGGLGTHIIRSVMDEVEYSQREGGGMQLRMVKYVGGVPLKPFGDPLVQGEVHDAG